MFAFMSAAVVAACVCVVVVLMIIVIIVTAYLSVTTNSAPVFDVSCGNHRADSCSECPYHAVNGTYMGKDWCNGDCMWMDAGSYCWSKSSTHSMTAHSMSAHSMTAHSVTTHSVTAHSLTTHSLTTHSVTGDMIDDGTMGNNGVPLPQTPLTDRPLLELDFASQGQGDMVLALVAGVMIVCSITLCWCYRFKRSDFRSKRLKVESLEGMV